MNTPEVERGRSSAAPTWLPEALVDRWMRPLVRFLRIESASGAVLLICSLIALALANSPWASSIAEFWHIHARIGVGSLELDLSLLHWVNDGLMTIFFFVVGLEIKRELVTGELRDPKKAALPVVAALGGMVVPAAIYASLRGGQPGHSGWGIPMATDIAFVVGFLALLGQRVSLGLKILLLSLAIADDIGAVVVIAVFYSSNISLLALALGGVGFGVVILLHGIGVRRVGVYVVVGAAIWLAFFKSGVHPTVAGVLLGLLTPARPWVRVQTFRDAVGDTFQRLQHDADGRLEHHEKPIADQVETVAREAVSPLERLETALHPWVAFVVMPLFALANAGITVVPGALSHPITLAVAAGLLFGKPIGIVLLSWLAVQLGLARLPTGVNWRVMIGAGCLAGIGFTMSLFIAGLALEADQLDAGKLGTLAGSSVSAVIGSFLLVLFLPKRPSGGS